MSSRRSDAALRALRALSFAIACAAAPGVAAVEVNTLLPWHDGATPPLALADLQGRPFDLSKLRGKTVIVNFWATWCVPCREEMPSLAALAAGSQGRIVVLAIDVGEAPARVERFVARYPVDVPILLDAHGDTAAAWRVGVYPSSFVIGIDGRVHAWIAGALDWQEAAVVHQVETAAAAPAR
ncbi:MAG: TlpA disulfide reductase family protein [Casimicrobiaceae bacterium]